LNPQTLIFTDIFEVPEKFFNFFCKKCLTSSHTGAMMAPQATTVATVVVNQSIGGFNYGN